MKILLTCFPTLPGELIRDLDYQERVAFPTDDLRACQDFLARHTAQLDPALFTQGTLTYLRLGQGKAQKLREEEGLLRRGVANSMHFLGKLQHIQVQDCPVARLDELHFQRFCFPVASPEWQTISLKDPRDQLSPVDLHIGFAPVESATTLLREEPAFYKYFPAGDETAPYALVLHSNVLSVESNRRKLHDNLINQQLLRLAASQLAARLTELTTAPDLAAAHRIWAGLVLSDPPTASSHAWQRPCFYAPLLAAAQEAVPATDGFLPPAQVKVKHTELPVAPVDFGLSQLAWFYWPYGHEVTKAAANKEKIGLEAWGLADLLPRPPQSAAIQQWLDELPAEYWPALRRELGQIPASKWSVTWTRADNTSFTLWQRFAELHLFAHAHLPRRVSLQEFQADTGLLLLREVNPTNQTMLEALGFTVFVLVEHWTGTVLPLLLKAFAWLDPDRRNQGSLELLERIRQRLPAAHLTGAQKHRLLAWLAALPGLGESTLRKLVLFCNAAGERKPLDELAQAPTLLPAWLDEARLHPDEESLGLNLYLLKPSELYAKLIRDRWPAWQAWLMPERIADFCRPVAAWYQEASNQSPLPGGAGALTAAGWLPAAQVFYHSALSAADSYSDLAAAIYSLYGWQVPVAEMLPWLAQPPFQLGTDRLGNAAPTQTATLTAQQLRELLHLASADQADLTQHLTIRAAGDAYLLTPCRTGGFTPYFTTHEPLIAYVAAELPQLHLLPADKLLADLQQQVLHGSPLYESLVQLTPPARLRQPELVSLLAASGYSTVQRRYLERLPELSFSLEDDVYPPSHPDRQLLQLAANPQVLAPTARPAFRRRLSLAVPGTPTFLVEGAAVNDSIQLLLEPDRTVSLSRARLLPGSDQRSAYVNYWADRLVADNDLRDLLGLGTPADLPQLQTELQAELQPLGYQLQNATQLAFVLLTARYVRTLGTANLLARFTALTERQQARQLLGSWYLAPLPFLDPAYVLAENYRAELPTLLGSELLPRRWAIEGSSFELLRRPIIERDHFRCPGLLSTLETEGQAALLEFLYQRWLTIVAANAADWPAEWATPAGQPAGTVLGFVPAHLVDAPGLNLPEEALPDWVQAWATRNSPTQKKQFLAALGVATPASPVGQLRQAFRSAAAVRAVELLASFAVSATSTRQLTNTLHWLHQQGIALSSAGQHALLTELYRRLLPATYKANVFAYLTAAAEDSCTYRILPVTEAVMQLDAAAKMRLAEHEISVPHLLTLAQAAGYVVLDLAIYPAEWQQALQGKPIRVEVEYDRATLQDQATAVPLPGWQQATRTTVYTYPNLLPQFRTLLGQSLPTQAVKPCWTDTTTNCVYVTEAYLPQLPDLLAQDSNRTWPASGLTQLRQELLATQLASSESEVRAMRTELERLRELVARQEEAQRFAASLPTEPDSRKVRPTGHASPDEQVQLSREAKDAVKAALPRQGYDCTGWREEFTSIHGVMREGQPVPIVVKRVGGGILYLTPNEWTFLASSPLAQLFVFDLTHQVRSVSLTAVEARNPQFFMQFNVGGPHVIAGIKAFAEFFKYLPYSAHFIFDVPGHDPAAEFTESFGLWQRHQPPPDEAVAPSPDSLD